MVFWLMLRKTANVFIGNCGDIMLDNIDRYGNNTALIHNNNRMNYYELSKAIKDTAFGIKEKICHDEIAICMNSGIEQIICVLGAVYSGKSIYLLHPGVETNTISILIEEGVFFVSDDDNWCKLESKGCDAISFKSIKSNYYKKSSSRESKANIIFSTSGTTSVHTKFVKLPYKSLMLKSQMILKTIEIEPTDRTLMLSPLCFIQSFWTALIHLYSGACICIDRFCASSFNDMLRIYGITTFIIPPSIVRGVLPYLDKSHPIRLLGTGGDYMDIHTLQRLGKHWADTLYYDVYGCTETCAADIIFGPVKLGDFESEAKPIGKSTEFSSIRIVDEKRNEVASFIEGEIEIKSALTPTKYHLRESAITENDGYFRTRDIGYHDDNDNIYYLGRVSGKIVYNGQKIIPQEVEEILYRIESIQSAVLVGEAHPVLGEKPILYVVGEKLDKEEIIKILRQYLEPYKIPKEVNICTQLPLTNSCKIKRMPSAFVKVEEFGYNG